MNPDDAVDAQVPPPAVLLYVQDPPAMILPALFESLHSLHMEDYVTSAYDHVGFVESSAHVCCHVAVISFLSFCSAFRLVDICSGLLDW